MTTTTPNVGSALANDLLHQIGETVGDSAKAAAVFGEPIHRDQITLVPVARARYGFGGGAGTNAHTSKSSGGGGGGAASITPIGYIEISNDAARFKRIANPADLLALAAAASLAALAIGRLLTMRPAHA